MQWQISSVVTGLMTRIPLAQISAGMVLGVATAVSLSDVGYAKPSATERSRTAESTVAIAQLRTQGIAGLQTFLKSHTNELTLNPLAPQLPAPHLRAALDALCQQRDCHASHLYWYTDLEQAKLAAKVSKKPILSLRLLGRLDEELSCANSRFFRVALYPNASVSKYLRDHFVLHWQSVRPVPKVTIDFGDGRKLERTVTGNSIHYILDSDGNPVEALPGLYGPQAFLQQLQQAAQLVNALSPLQGQGRTTVLRQYHRDRLATIQANWATDLKTLRVPAMPLLVDLPQLNRTATAEEAGQLAMTKMAVENPLLRAIRGISTSAEQNRQRLSNATDNPTWLKLAQRHADKARLDRNSQALIRSKNPVYQLSPQSRAGSASDPLQPIVRSFETAMALDTVRNEYLLHTQLHQWFLQGADTTTLEAFNDRVYAQLFLTPNSDPWLGLLSGDAYSAIEGNGVKQ